jgi:glycine/D-amino acid oxidase-like deaminating enzyme
MHQVVVVGAGILGASISRHLSLRGAHVSVLEAAPAPAAGATGKSWCVEGLGARRGVVHC